MVSQLIFSIGIVDHGMLLLFFKKTLIPLGKISLLTAVRILVLNRWGFGDNLNNTNLDFDWGFSFSGFCFYSSRNLVNEIAFESIFLYFRFFAMFFVSMLVNPLWKPSLSWWKPNKIQAEQIRLLGISRPWFISCLPMSIISIIYLRSANEGLTVIKDTLILPTHLHSGQLIPDVPCPILTA